MCCNIAKLLQAKLLHIFNLHCFCLSHYSFINKVVMHRTPCMKDPSSLGTHHHLGQYTTNTYHAAGVLVCA